MTSTDQYEFEALEDDFYPWAKEKSHLIIKLLEGKKILEVGCGTGYLLSLINTTNIELSGSDYWEVYLEKAKKKNPNLTFFKGDLTDPKCWKNFENSYDGIICSEVIEHMKDDLNSLKIIWSLLKPNGILILTTPAFNFLYSKFDKKLGHYRRYSKKSLNDIMEKAGFKIEKIRYWNFLGMCGWFIFFKLFQKNIQQISNPLLGNILGKWLKLESRITMPVGQTIIVKARKMN